MTTLDLHDPLHPPKSDWLTAPRDAVGPVQLIDPDGRVTAAGTEYGIDLALARRLHRDMVLARRLDHEALALQRQGELNLWLMCWGQEAAQVGSVQALRDDDMVFPSYREHAAALARGISPAELLLQWRGSAHSGWDPLEYSFHIYSLVLGTQTLHATGYAQGVVLDGSSQIVTVYFGDGAASQGDVNEALNWAAVAHLPVLFFCQNNQWAISTPTSLQMRTPLHTRAAGFGLDAYHVDGNDVLGVHAVTQAAVERIRSGRGPALIEAVTYRRAGHSTSDDPGRYRSAEEAAAWEARDPISRIERLLHTAGTPEQFFLELQQESDELAEQVRSACRSLPEPRMEDLFASTYAEPHPLVDRERASYLAAAGLS
jgi:2-oxoisovalerate dehydrogenase E1 component alpha subunit